MGRDEAVGRGRVAVTGDTQDGAVGKSGMKQSGSDRDRAIGQSQWDGIEWPGRGGIGAWRR